ncbi:MAG: hypothetical protein Q4G12_03400, partial [Bacteroidales bacterium]|nr:hypothetical protein [Bacteroidales bacterium]
KRPCPQKSPKNTYIFSAFEVSRPYRVWFFVEGEQYFSTEPGLYRPLKKHPIKSRSGFNRVLVIFMP